MIFKYVDASAWIYYYYTVSLFSVTSSNIVNYTIYNYNQNLNSTVDFVDSELRPSLNLSRESESDVIEQFLEQVELYKKNKGNCTPGTHHNLGKGVKTQYGLYRFKNQALVAVNRANFLTRIWKKAEPGVLESEYLFYTQVRSIVESDPDIFAAGNCYDAREFKAEYFLYCPYAHRMDNGEINVKDLSLEYHYLGNSSEWFISARMISSNLSNFNFTVGTEQWRINDNTSGSYEYDSTITVTYEHGHWSLPYFDCGGGNIWMMTYTVPFFGYSNGTFKFK
ncbi:hypothetical protein LOTGIDRAFT_127101 [Lottia gigantea]|uniref:Uncharacterized protein n=1 Tax=Lottia gigantea TaxID=225164 RepID=V3ZAC2_LOTGI|nr:hypothetical protein LOTGIDRAFT_127101 [Lottia gigantea]ESO87903.1 hypothetical protein LOTGIDRAFT_127101 [Lottia gigantea]